MKNNLIVALGALVFSIALGYGLELSNGVTGLMAAGLYWMHCK